MKLRHVWFSLAMLVSGIVTHGHANELRQTTLRGTFMVRAGSPVLPGKYKPIARPEDP